LAQVRVEQKQKYANELARIKTEYEMKLVEQKEATSKSEALNKQWLEEKEKVDFITAAFVKINLMSSGIRNLREVIWSFDKNCWRRATVQ
jgi:hypothetical protein